MTRITDRKIPCVYIHIYQIIKDRAPGPYNSLRHANNRKYFSGLSLTRNWRESHMLYLSREVGRIWRCSCWEKGNFIMISEFKYRQTWKMWPSPLSLSLYNTFKLIYLINLTERSLSNLYVFWRIMRNLSNIYHGAF